MLQQWGLFCDPSETYGKGRTYLERWGPLYSYVRQTLWGYFVSISTDLFCSIHCSPLWRYRMKDLPTLQPDSGPLEEYRFVHTSDTGLETHKMETFTSSFSFWITWWSTIGAQPMMAVWALHWRNTIRTILSDSYTNTWKICFPKGNTFSNIAVVLCNELYEAAYPYLESTACAHSIPSNRVIFLVNIVAIGSWVWQWNI